MGVLVIPEPGVPYNVISRLIQLLKDLQRSVKEYARRREIERTIEGLETSLREFTSLAREFASAIDGGGDAERWLLNNVHRIMSVRLALLPHLQRAFEVIPELKGKTFEDLVEYTLTNVEDEDLRVLLDILRDANARGLDRYLHQSIETLSAEMLQTMLTLGAALDFLASVVVLHRMGEIVLSDEGKVRGVFRRYINEFAEFWEDVELMREMEENETGNLVSIDEIMAVFEDEGGD